MADNVSTIQLAGRGVAQIALVLELFQNVLVDNGSNTPCLPRVGHSQWHPGLDTVTPLQEVVHTQLDAFAGKHFVVPMAVRKKRIKITHCHFCNINIGAIYTTVWSLARLRLGAVS